MVAGTILCAVLSLAFGFMYPALTQMIINNVIKQGRGDLLTFAALGLLGAFFLQGLFNSFRIRINNRLEQNVIYNLRCEVYDAHHRRCEQRGTPAH